MVDPYNTRFPVIQSVLHLFRSLFTLLIILLLSSCALNEEIPQSKIDDNELYQGKSSLAFMGLDPPESVEEALQNGDQSYANEDLDRALFEYLRALELDKENPITFYKVGKVHTRKGNDSLSALAYRKALSLNPNHIDSLEELGLLYLKENDYEQAETLFKQASKQDRERIIGLNPELPGDSYSPLRAYNGLGIIHDIRGEYNQAQGYYQTSLAIHPRSSSTLNNLGYSQYLHNLWSEAEQSFRRALKYDSSYAQARKNLGLLYSRQGRYFSALNAFEQIMDSAHAYNDVGYICLLEGKYERAIEFFNKAIALSPHYYEKARENLAQAKRLKASQISQVVQNAGNSSANNERVD